MNNMSNFNHFTGKKSPLGQHKRKKKVKVKRVHKNKYIDSNKQRQVSIMDYSLDLILELLEIGSLIVVLVCFPILLGLLHINKKVYGYASYPTDDIKSHTTFEKMKNFTRIILF